MHHHGVDQILVMHSIADYVLCRPHSFVNHTKRVDQILMGKCILFQRKAYHYDDQIVCNERIP